MPTILTPAVPRCDRAIATLRGPIVAEVGRRGRLTSFALDWTERALLFVLYAWLIHRMFQAYQLNGGLVSFALLPSVTLLMVLTLCRRRASRFTRRPVDWFVAWAASVSPLLFTPLPNASIVHPACGVIIITWGWLIDLYAQFTLGRSFGCVPANRGLKVDGPYRFVRHPMYAGYLISHVGFLLINATWLNLMIFVACYATQVPRLFLEERLLGEEPRYRNYMKLVPYRLIPGVF
jgi:protein-S-isoprenylcysteine O-methyltransferase Ste14